MVTVCVAVLDGAAVAEPSCGFVPSGPSYRLDVPWTTVGAPFAACTVLVLIGVTATGSPPNGLLPKVAHNTNTPRNSASAPPRTCDVETGIDIRRFFF